jgi:Holliday junction resolvase RusA-like endonuclease
VYNIPSEAYEVWDAQAQPQFAKIRSESKVTLPIGFDVNVRALFMRQTNIGDAVGFYQSLADSMEKGGILINDRQIVSWDGSRMLKDAKNPRIIVTVERAE